MAKQEVLEFEGLVIEILPNQMFKVQINETAHIVLAQTNGRMRKNRISILVGDKVTLETATCDITRGRISRRL